MLKPGLKNGYDLILLVYPSPGRQELAGRSGQLKHLFSKAGLLQ